MRRWIKRHWKLTILIAVVAVGGCSYGMLEYTHNPRFCLSCHVMQPYYDAWASSSHNKVSCVECHYQPGLRYELEGKLDALNQVVAYWTGRYDTKFYAEIADESCMRQGCHDTRLIGGPIEFKRGIKFDHASHYGEARRDIKLRCTSCHSQIVQGNHMAVTEFTCFLCHFKGQTHLDSVLPQAFCLRCHSYPTSIIDVGGVKYNHADYVEHGVICWRCHSDVIRGSGQVEDRACLQCHDSYDQIKKITDVTQVHLNHVTNHKVECFNCHANIEHGIPPDTLPSTFDCSACHHDTHSGPRELYAGQGGRGVADQPSPMYLAQVDCTGCHFGEMIYGVNSLEAGGTRLSSVEACVDCHGEMGREIYKFWTTSVDAQLADTQRVLVTAQARLGKQAKPTAAAVKQLEDAWYNYNFVKQARGVHNLTYSLALLEQARADAASAQVQK
jgi:nitrate/TMAO reductase-like tetraheme cytochrome c subunit